VTISVGVTIAAPPDVVWRTVEQVERHVDWMADAESITFVGPTTRGPGTTFDCVTRIGPLRTVDRMRVTQWEPGRVLAIEHEGVVRGSGRFELVAAGCSTRFTWTESLRFPWWMGSRAGAFVASPLLRRIWRANLVRLKHIVEGS
jgi:carbon monoxide dehydrogenase subunit G